MMKRLALAALFASLATPAFAQVEDEIIVTGVRTASVPGQSLIVRGDNLLLEVEIESDAREQAERVSELTDTIKAFIDAAEDEDDISLSFVDGNAVRPLRPSLFYLAIGKGPRPDTSVATIQIKAPIPDTVEDAFAISTRLSAFVASIPEEGRISIDDTGEVVISVVNPRQYRPRVIKLVIDEINDVREQLGPNYHVVLNDIDSPMSSYRAGDLSLGFYIPYDYTLIPENIAIYNPDY